MEPTTTPITPTANNSNVLAHGTGGGAVTMNFPDAIRQVIDGKRIARLSWAPAGDYGIMKDGWLMILTNNQLHKWNLNDGDLKGQDWIVVKEKN